MLKKFLHCSRNVISFPDNKKKYFVQNINQCICLEKTGFYQAKLLNSRLKKDPERQRRRIVQIGKKVIEEYEKKGIDYRYYGSGWGIPGRVLIEKRL
jgi:hypothetical protein